MVIKVPTRELELAMLAKLKSGVGPEARLGGVDEVGRGALAGPVSVGIAVVDGTTPDEFPAGLRDSKMLSAGARERIVEQCRQWPVDLAVGHAGPEIVDRLGIIGALRAAAGAAYRQLAERGHAPDAILLDGTHDWWSAASLWDPGELPNLPVHTQVKGDANCAVVAAASVAAKVERDHLMSDLSQGYPRYDWAKNKGYSSPTHIEALSQLGPCQLHRQSWKLPGVGGKSSE
ncbi:ribonuclease HII [Ancrocorticia populi]|uniref:Ribonuclease n=1 Tax=Ancrocorticia populi TaxID=2175228 RepID=A0A2V1K666_9ACTO|nr:ribonuclease HII [Ancrocorticia populi]PWF25733.1 ribonuclease HII [Ancrocorticia populi]